MHIDQIILFKNIVEQETISQGALLSNISQPAATKQLQSLEEELGVRLIERTNRGIKVTEAGDIFYQFTLEVTDMYNSVSAKITDWKYNKESLEISACPVISNYVLPEFIFDLKKKHPMFNFNIYPTNTETVVSRVLTGYSKLGFCVDLKPHKELILEKMFDDEIALIASPYYKIADEIILSDLQDHLVIILDKGHSYYKKIEHEMALIGVDLDSLQNVQQYYTIEAIKYLLIKGKGVSLIPRRSVINELKSGQLREVSVEGLNIPFEIFAITHKDNYITPLMHEIISKVKGLQ